MADKKEKEKAPEGEAEATPKSGLVKMLAIVAAVLIVPTALAAGVYIFVLAPRLQPADPKAKAEHTEEGGEDAAKGEEEHGGGEKMAGASAVEFEDESVNIAADGPNAKAAILTYKCAIVVNSEELATEIGEKTKKPFFSSILLRLHSNRTKTELNDPRVKESILRQAKQEANALLKKLFPENKEAKIVDVLHVKYTIFDI